MNRMAWYIGIAIRNFIMAQNRSDINDLNENPKMVDASDIVERRATERMLEPTITKFDPTYETPENQKLLQAATNPSSYEGGISKYYFDSDQRLKDQAARVKEPDCTIKEIEAMHNNNTYMAEAAGRRLEVVLSRANRANFVNDGSLSMS